MNPFKKSLKTCLPRSGLLKANLEIIKQFHDAENLHSVALTQTLVQNVMRSRPIEVGSSFNDQLMEFRGQDPDNVRPSATFSFLT